ncbi:alpha-2-macroglobulin-like protein 1 [Leptodactylus fuscus]|uniref:alpha-2-macroglobulin-like protein 1 n=1 Tax=Leptodactylus fuscus TaxID=238119 RepID=UPI003F4E7B78
MCIADLSFVVSDDPVLGIYTINVENGLASANFKVKEIVLPRYDVAIEKPTSIYALDSAFPLKVCARYTYGKGVQGNLLVTICRKGICNVLREETDATGCFQTTVNGYLLSLMDPSFYYADVQITAVMVENGTGIQFSVSQTIPVSYAAVQLSFEASDPYYRAGNPYQITLLALGRDDVPLQYKGVSLEVQYGSLTTNVDGITDHTGRMRFNLNTFGWTGQVTIRGYTRDKSTSNGPFSSQISDPTQYVLPFYSEALSYLRLVPISDTITCGRSVSIRVEYDINPNDLNSGWRSVQFYYIVMGKNGIMLNGQITILLGSTASFRGFLTVPITFTSNFGPAPKMLGFLLLNNGTMVANRLLFNVEKCFPNLASLRFSRPEASPKDQLNLHVQSSAGSMCAVRAVDKSVQISNEDKELTTEKVYGLFQYLVRGGYPYSVQERQFNPCRWPIPIIPLPPIELSRIFLPYSRYEYVDVLTLCMETGTKILTNARILQPAPLRIRCPMFVDAFAEVQNVVVQKLPEVPVSAPSDAVRRYFPDTWLWQLVLIGPFGRSSLVVTVPDTITTFNARTFCVGDIGFGLSPQVSLTVFKPFFVEISTPYAIYQGETLLLKATVFNYLRQCLMVQVTLLDSTEFSVRKCLNCIYSRCVCPNQAVTFTWYISTNQIGLVTINVRAEAVASSELCEGRLPYVPSSGNLDILQRQLLVKPAGIQKEVIENMYLCLNASVDSIQKSFSLKLPRIWVYGSEKAYMSVVGDLLGTTLQNLDRLVRMPGGCGEQNMLTMAPIIYVMGYLEATVQLDGALRQKAIGYLRSGYQQELLYKRTDGSYSAFGNSDADGSTWLTAFVCKCFFQAKRYILIDNDVLRQGVTWLGQQQQSNGCFISRGILFHPTMKGGVQDDLSLSAYITAAFLEGGMPVTDIMVSRALSCLRTQVATSSNPYTMALLGYTFALANDHVTKQILLDRLLNLAVSSGGDLYWEYTLPSSGGSESANVELTSYVLMVLTTGNNIPTYQIISASRTVSWLTKKQNSDGGFYSTQDTVVGIQAMAKYSELVYSSRGTVYITVFFGGRTLMQFTVNGTNQLLFQKEPLPYVPGSYSLNLRGNGCVFIQCVLKYNVLPVKALSVFSLFAEIEDCDNGMEEYTLHVSVGYIGARKVTNMVIIEVNMLSGFQPVSEAYVLLKQSPKVKRVTIQEGTINIYLEKLDHTIQDYYIIIWPEIEVLDLKPATVRVYDYYLPEENAVTTYSACQ